MLNTKEFLKCCSSLNDAGCLFDWSVGTRLGRGFADFGFEEFYILPRDQVLSIITGKVSQLQEDERNFLFVIPTASQLTDKIDLMNCDVKSLKYTAQKRWLATVERVGGSEPFEVEADSPEQALIGALMLLIKKED
jgi:hypothetical protein